MTQELLFSASVETHDPKVGMKKRNLTLQVVDGQALFAENHSAHQMHGLLLTYDPTYKEDDLTVVVSEHVIHKLEASRRISLSRLVHIVMNLTDDEINAVTARPEGIK